LIETCNGEDCFALTGLAVVASGGSGEGCLVDNEELVRGVFEEAGGSLTFAKCPPSEVRILDVIP
jgi:hypothetical protein